MNAPGRNKVQPAVARRAISSQQSLTEKSAPMKKRRDFLATTIATAALLTNSSAQSGPSTGDEIGRKVQSPVTQFQEVNTWVIREKIHESPERAAPALNK